MWRRSHAGRSPKVSLERGPLFEVSGTCQRPSRGAKTSPHRPRCGQSSLPSLKPIKPLLSALSKISFDEPFYAVPEALNLRAAQEGLSAFRPEGARFRRARFRHPARLRREPIH